LLKDLRVAVVKAEEVAEKAKIEVANRMHQIFFKN
jgi:hypothetical protein